MVNKKLILQKKEELRLTYSDISAACGYKTPSAFFKQLQGTHEIKSCHILILSSLLDISLEDMFMQFPTDGDA